jgi:hypothetical protein
MIVTIEYLMSCPTSGSYNRCINATVVDFPLPDTPTSAVVSPDLQIKLKYCNIGSFDLSLDIRLK